MDWQKKLHGIKNKGLLIPECMYEIALNLPPARDYLKRGFEQ